MTRHLITLLITATLSQASTMRLGWDAAPGATSYEVWRGIERLAVVTATEASIHLPSDRISTLTVRAINSTGTSPHSEPFDVMPVTAQYSPDLRNWQTGSVFFVESKSSQFFRFAYPLTSIQTP